MKLPLGQLGHRSNGWTLGLLVAALASVGAFEAAAQDANQPKKPARPRSTTSTKKPPEQPTAEPVQPTGEQPGREVAPNFPKQPGSEAGDAAAQPGTQPAGAANPEPAATPPSPTGAEQLIPPPDDAPVDPAKRAEEARKAAQERAKARRDRAAGPGANPMPTTIPAQANQPIQQPAAGNPPPEMAGREPDADAGPSTTLNIAPIESSVPAEDRIYGFSIKDGSYEMLVEGFAKQTGMGVIGDVPKDGKVTFVTTETLNFDQALARVRMLLFNYKPHEPFWIVRQDNNLQVIRVNDFYRILPRDRMYSSLEEFRAAKLSPDELALVIYTPDTGSVSDLRQVRDWLPDYVRVTPLEDQNRVTIFALVSDIEKYMGLIRFFAGGSKDPRTLERIEVHHVLANEVLTKLRSLMDLDGVSPVGKATPAPARRGGGAAREPSPLDNMPEPQVSVIADDVLGLLIVRAMKDKIDEIKLLLPYIDVDASGASPTPTIVKLQYVDAAEMINTVQQILSTSGAGASPTPSPKPKRGKKAAGAAGAAATPSTAGEGSADAVTMLPHPSDNAIIVLADDAGVARVRDLVQMFDVSNALAPVRITLQHADANEVLNTITSVYGVPGKKGPSMLDRFQVIVDPAGDSIWYVGKEPELEKVRDMVAMLDVASEPVVLHIVNCKYQTPTFLSNMLREFDTANPGSSAPAAATKKPKAKRVKTNVPASKFTPDDARKQLFVICSDEEFTRYQELLSKLDQPADLGQAFVKIPFQNVGSDQAVERIQGMISAAGGDENVRLIAVDGAMLVLGATPEDVDRIKSFIAEVDKPSNLEKRTFDILHGNAGDIKTAIESLMSDAPVQSARKRGKGEAKGGATISSSVSTELTITQVGQRLFVQASPERMKEVASLIAEFDVEEHRTEMKVYSDFAPGTNIEALSETVSSVFGGAQPGVRKGKDVGGEGPKFIPQPASGRLLVIAEPSAFPEIEKLLTVLRHEVETRPTVVAFVEVKDADPAELVEIVRPLLDIKIRGLVDSGELGDAVEDGGVVTPTKSTGRRKPLASAAGATSDRYHLAADARNRRIVVAAPQVVVDQAKSLIAQFDLPADKPILKRVQLTNASPADMVKAVTEMMGRPTTRQRTTSGKGGGKSTTTTAASMELSSDGGLSVVEAPGGSAVLLHGRAAEVTEAEDWIHQLDAMSVRGRTIKVYDIKNADMEKLFDLIVNVVGASAGKGPPKKKSSDDESDEESAFVTTRTHSSQDLYIQADLLGHSMMVAATSPKIAEIDDIVARVDGDPEVVKIMEPTSPVDKFTYECVNADADDVAWELEGVLKKLWEPQDQLPEVEEAGFGNNIIVRYPDKSRFAEIEDYIVRFADKPNPDDVKIIKKSFTPPPGLSAQEAVLWLRTNRPELEIELVDKGPKTQPTYGLERLTPLDTSKQVAPCVLPASLLNAASGLLSEVLGQPEPVDEPVEEEGQELEEPEPVPVPSADDLIRRAVTPATQSKSKTKTSEKAADKSSDKAAEKAPDTKDSKSEREKPKKVGGDGGKMTIYYDDTKGVFVVEGQSATVGEVQGWIDDLEKEIEDFPVKPDIRIIRVRYIDVFTAQDILEEMFNLTKQQQAQISAQQQAAMRAQQAATRQPNQAAGGRGQQNDQTPGAPGAPGQPVAGPGGRPGAALPGQVPGQPGAVPQLPAAGVRIYPNPRDRTLILRAEASQYPQILELLATIDQPKPIESFMRSYPLKNLKASEVEETLRELLGIQKGETGRRSARAANTATPGITAGTGPGESLPQTIVQETVSGASKLGLDPEDIKLFSSDVSNTVMAMAPVAALDFIGEMIKKLESEDIPQRLTHYFSFKNADVEDVAEYLTQHFAEKATSSGKIRKSGGDGAAPAASSEKGLNAPSFIPYQRLGLLTVHANKTQMDEVEDLVKKLDVKGEQEKWENVVLAYADAKVVADTLTQVFGEKGAAAGTKGSKPSVAKFVGEPGGGMVFYSAPVNLQAQVIEAIQKLEKQYQTTGTPRIIDLKNGTPSSIAEAIEKAYEGKQAKGSTSAKSRFTITAHDPTKRLFVVADDKMFAEVEALAKLLDDKPGTIGVEFRIYPMQYASAKAIHAQLTKLLKDYMSRLKQGENPIEAFSVEPDEISNSLIVLGGPTVFGFIEENLRKIDTPAMRVSLPGSLIIPLSNGNAQEVAANITKLYTSKEQPLGVTPPQVEANPATNTLIIRGSQQQVDEIKRDIIDPLEAQSVLGRQVQNKPIKLKFADPSAVSDVITKLFRTDSRQPRDQVTAVAEHTSNSVIVGASPENLKKVEELIAKIDSADVSQQDVHVVEIKYADSASVAQTLTEIFVRAGAKQIGNQPPAITIAAVPGSRAILIKCKAEDFARIKETLASLDTEDVGTAGEVRMVTLLYSDAGEVAQALEKYLNPSGGTRGGKLLGDAKISAMSQTNTVMISAAKDEVDRLVEITKTMDIAGEKGSVPQIISMKFAKAGMILPSVQAVFTESRGGGGRRNQAPPVIVADDGANALIVRAGPTEMAAIEAIVRQLDTEESVDRTPYRLVQVKAGINVSDLAEQVETTINQSAETWGSGTNRKTPKITITPNQRTNSLMIGGDSSLFAQAETLIKKLEEMGPTGSVATRIIPVDNIKVEQIRQMVDQLTQPQGGSSSGGGRRSKPAGRP